MLTAAELEELFERLGTPEAGRSRIRRMRDSLPSRATRTNKMSGKTRYVPVKMPFVIEAEATTTEYLALVEYDHDPEVLEFYSQVEALNISYALAGSGRRVTFPTTPDIFCITHKGFVLIECKTEQELASISRKNPNRYIRDDERGWRSPPAERAAGEFGCSFQVRSSASNNWTLFENLEMLKDYVSACTEFDNSRHSAALARIEEHGWVSVFDLVHSAPAIPADDLYRLIASKALFFPIATQRLSEQERAFVFRDAQTYNAHHTFLSVTSAPQSGGAGEIVMDAGCLFTWDDKPWQIVNNGSTVVTIQRLDDNGRRAMAELAHADFMTLVREGRIHADSSQASVCVTPAEELLRRASTKDLQEAQARYCVLREGAAHAEPFAGKVSRRTYFYWQRDYRNAEARYGNGFVGLLPQRRGNRMPKASEAALKLADEVIVRDWETIRHKSRQSSYGKYAIESESVGITAISYVSFCKRVKNRHGFAQRASRLGEKAAYDVEPQYLELEYTTPRHGVRPWHIGHIDHTPLPLKILHSKDGAIERRVWLTMLIDANTRKILAYYLSFDEPSYRSCMMVLRDCVRRHNRVPQIIVCDRGSEFSSIYWETQLALVRVTKRDRRAGRPREGSVCERIFNTLQSQFVKALLGATDVVETHFRRISPEVRPERHAVWTLDRLDVGFQRYLDEVYHVCPHGGLGMSPNEAWALGLKSHGERMHIAIPYDRLFIIQSCPAVHRGTVKVSSAGVKVNYRWFKCEALSRPGLLGTKVPARYEPFNAGVAYVFVQGEWHEARSELYAVYANRSEREIRLSTEHLKLTDRVAGLNRAKTAEMVARFLSSIEVEELQATQLRSDRESRAHRGKINTPHLPSPDTTFAESPRDNVSPLKVVGNVLEDL